MDLAPVSFFVYNRPFHTKQTLESLQKNIYASQTELFIFSDGPKDAEAEKNVREVRKYLKTISGFKKINITKRKKNLGLANSIISGVTEIIHKFGKVIVIEDDLVFTAYFLKFMNEALGFYKDKEQIFSVSGYSYPGNIFKIPANYKHDVYFFPRCSSWGWGTWENRWSKADWKFQDAEKFVKNKKLQQKYNRTGEDKTEMMLAYLEGKIDSWATRWEYAHFINNAYSVYPTKSFLNNIGFDGTGVNCDYEKKYSYSEGLKECEYNITFLDKIEINKKIFKAFNRIFKKDRFYFFKSIIKKIILYDKWRKKK